MGVFFTCEQGTPVHAVTTRSDHKNVSSCIGCAEREFFIDNLLVRIHLIIVMIRWTGLAPSEFEFPFPGSLTSAFLAVTTRSDCKNVSRWIGCAAPRICFRVLA